MKDGLGALWRTFCLMLGNQRSLQAYLLPLLHLLWPGYLPGLYRARLQRKYWQTADMLHLTLTVSTHWPGFEPGQHVLLTLRDQGRLISRPFSICSPLADWQSKRQISLCCKISADGSFTPQLSTLNASSELNISAASGDFIWRTPATPTVFIAGGSGITPIASMLLSQRHFLAAVVLHYRFRGQENAALLAQLQQLAERQPLFTLHLSDSRLQTAEDFGSGIQVSANTQYLLCGPSLFMQHTRQQLLTRGVAEKQLQQEQFGPALLPVQAASNTTETTLISTTFIAQGKAHRLAASSANSLLQSAEQLDLTPQFGCRMGVCFQCVCDKVSGQVRDLRSGSLSGHGAEQIQLCISQPVSDLVIKL